jgi:hypothetical protein
MKNSSFISLISGFLGFLMFLAIFDLPYSYYEFLRPVVFIGSILLIFLITQQNSKLSLLIMLISIIALLFNPIIPIYSNRVFWLPVNILSGSIFSYLTLYFGKRVS